MKPRVKRNIQNECRSYIEAVKAGKIQPLMIEGGDQKFPYFNGFVQNDRNSYRNMLSSMIGDPRFAQTISGTIDSDDLKNPYHIFPIGDDYCFFMNDNIASLEATIMEDPIGVHLEKPQILEPRASFPANLVNLLAVIADRYRMESAPASQEDLGKLDRHASAEDRAQIAKKIRLLKGKISLAKRNLRKGSEGAQKRIDLLRAEIERLRKIYQKEPETAKPKPPQKMDRRHQILRMAQEMRGRGFTQIFKFLVSIPLERYLREDLQNAFQKKIPHQISALTSTIKMMDSDMIVLLDLITDGYATLREIEPTDEMEIQIHTERYFIVSSKLRQDLNELFGTDIQGDTPDEETEEEQ